ncbi:hypothetical protein CISIN_1g034938mg [Citrus sinensis]|uniref:Uncharacterized protein n=1 Tax=Citrus sinensis TaxID=2711 RepID=A0A067DW74_CITSI|nr:hypothetical protein CISIN_1g034938mg [Citrus sinensis]
MKRKINQLELDEEIVKKPELLLIETSFEMEEQYDSSEEPQIDEIDKTSDSEKEINVLTRDQEHLLEVVNKIENFELRK